MSFKIVGFPIKVSNHPSKQMNFFHPSLDVPQSETYEHKYKFYNVLEILLEVLSVQFAIAFDKDAKNYLNYLKYKIGFEN